MGRVEVIDRESGAIVTSGSLTVTDLEGDRQAHRIPTNSQHEVDVMGVRTMPEHARVALAGIVAKIG
jgi:hypothetical protein